ncbi:retrotransposon protein, putative, ty1-copia subclass [Tanacetum coccineum]
MLPQDITVGLILNGLTKDFVGFVRNYNIHNMRKTIGELHAMLIEYKKGLPKKAEIPQVMMIRDGKIQKAKKKSLKAKGKNKVNGKGNDKKVYIPKPKNPKPTAMERPTKDDACHHCKEVGHWKRNCPVYLAELLNKKKQVGSASSLVSKNDVLYFNAIAHDRIYEIDMHDLVPNVNSIYNVSNKRVKHNLDSTYLWHCRLAHINKKYDKETFPYSNKRAKDFLGIIHIDVCGPLRHVSRQGASYFITFTDDYSRYGYVYLLKHKHEVFETFKVFKNEVENQLRKTSKAIRSDRGGEYISQKFKDYLKANGIVQQLTPPYTPQHNGVFERRNCTLLDMVRSMMNLTTLPLSFWDYALESATPILNMVLTKKALVKRDTPDKIEQRTIKCIFIGYPKEMMGYYFYFPPENKIVVARYVEFFEKCLISQEISGRAVDLEKIQEEEDTTPSEITSNIPQEVECFKAPQEEVILIRRSERTHRAPNYLCLNVEVEEHSLRDLGEPANYKAAMLDPESKRWVDAINAEMQSMIDNMVWVLVDLPPDSRLVAKGYTQTYMVDYEETFSPVADIRAIRILISIAVFYDYEIWQIDVKIALLNGYLDEDIYMVQHKGFVDPKHPRKVDPEKVKTITDWPRLSSVTEIRSFMGACYEAPVLALPNLQRPFKLETDASSYAMGAFLLRERETRGYHSKMFQGAQKNYPTYDKELLALHQAVKHWRCYLLGKETVVHTDHQPLQYLQSQDKLQQARHMKWMTYLQQLNIVQPSCHDKYASEYKNDPDFHKAIEDIKCSVPTEFTWQDFHRAIEDIKCSVPTEFTWQGGLPRTRKGNDYLFVVVDRFSKMVVLMPCKKTITGEEVARLFFGHVWKIFDLPTSIISDRDSRFLSNFWCSLWAKMDTKLKRSTAFHPQTDGQTRLLIEPCSINKAPSEVCLGFLPQSPFDMEFIIESTPRNDREEREELHLGKDRLKGEGKKLKPIRYGPFRILEKIGENAYKLELPALMELYFVVNIDKLQLFEPSMLDDEPGESLPSVDDLVTGQDAVLEEDTIVEQKTSSTHQGPAGAAPLLRERGGVIRDSLEQVKARPKIPPPPKREDLKDSICHQCGETGHWKRNYPQYLVELLKNKKLSQGASGSGAKGKWINVTAVDNTIQVSRNNMVYFSAIPRDGIFEIDLSNSYTNVGSIYVVSNKRAKLDLDSALLWHCRLGHISKKRIEKLQHDGLLNSTDLTAFEKCVSCMSGKMARKPYTH